jgi:hypothetical protein
MINVQSSFIAKIGLSTIGYLRSISAVRQSTFIAKIKLGIAFQSLQVPVLFPVCPSTAMNAVQQPFGTTTLVQQSAQAVALLQTLHNQFSLQAIITITIPLFLLFGTHLLFLLLLPPFVTVIIGTWQAKGKNLETEKIW